MVCAGCVCVWPRVGTRIEPVFFFSVGILNADKNTLSKEDARIISIIYSSEPVKNAMAKRETMQLNDNAD